MRRIFVVTCLPQHVDRTASLIRVLHLKFPGVPVGVANFGAEMHGDFLDRTRSLFPLDLFCAQNGILYYNADRQWFLPEIRDQHCCEIIGMLSVSRFFNELGYDYVYLLHSDVRIAGDFTRLESLVAGKWSFVATERLLSGTEDDRDNFRRMMLNERDPEKKKAIDIRLSQEIVMFNKDFVIKLYNVSETDAGLWRDTFFRSSLFGDIALYDLCPMFIGYTPVILKERLVEHS